MNEPTDRRQSLKSKAVSGAGWSGLAQLILQVMQFVVGITLVRLLLPTDFGLVGMVYIFTGFASVIAEMGMGAALIQKREVSELELSSTYWFNLLVGLAMMGVTIAIAPWLAHFFEEPRLTRIAQAISLTFLIGSINIVHLSLLTREFQFQKLAVLETISFLIGGIAAISAAVGGWGVWSLVIQALTTITLKAILAGFASGWCPRLAFSWPAVRDLFPFSFNLTLSKGVNYWVRNADNLLIGKFFGSGQLGIYSRAYSFMLVPISQFSSVISRVMFPALSTVQDDIPRMKRIYLRMLRVLALITFPASLGLMAVTDFFVLALMGIEWADVIPILRVLCVLSVTQSLGTTAGTIYQARGRTDLQFRWTLYASVVVISAFLIGLNWGALGVARAYVIGTLLFLTYPGVRVMGSLINLTFRQYVGNVAGIFGCAATMAATVYGAGWLLRPHFSPTICLIVLVVLGIVLYGTLIVVFRVQAYAELRALVAEKLSRATLT